jgi:hypothetical protein
MVVKDLRMGEFMHAKVEHDEVSESRKYSVGTAVSTPAMQNKWQKVSIPVIQRAKLMFQAEDQVMSSREFPSFNFSDNPETRRFFSRSS